MSETILSIRDLTVEFSTEDGIVRAVRLDLRLRTVVVAEVGSARAAA